VLKGRDIDDVTKLWLLGEFDRVLSLNLLDAAAKVRAANATATAKAAGAGEYTITGPADATEEETAKVTALLTARYEARKAKNWAESDRIRDELAAMGVVVKDSKNGAVWSRA
jgi:cysteinyl-tRNA synthetase